MVEQREHVHCPLQLSDWAFACSELCCQMVAVYKAWLISTCCCWSVIQKETEVMTQKEL